MINLTSNRLKLHSTSPRSISLYTTRRLAHQFSRILRNNWAALPPFFVRYVPFTDPYGLFIPHTCTTDSPMFEESLEKVCTLQSIDGVCFFREKSMFWHNQNHHSTQKKICMVFNDLTLLRRKARCR